MRSLNNIGVTVPGGFRWFCEDTKSYVPATGHMVSYTDFIHSCKKHALANNLPIGSQFEQQIQDQICRGLDGAWCRDDSGIPIRPASGWLFDIQSVIQGTLSLGRFLIKDKRAKVEPAEAERRASICVGCPFNSDPTGCNNCSLNALKEAANLIVGGAATRYDGQLKSCKVCGCSLRAKIHLPLDTLLTFLTKQQLTELPSHCWLLET